MADDQDKPLPWEDGEGDGINRRQAVHAAGAAALICVLPGAGTRKTDSVLDRAGRLGVGKYRTAAGRRTLERVIPDDFTTDLPIPPVLQPVSTVGDVDNYEITIEPGEVEILPGQPTPVIGYNGTFPGPTIAAERGREINVLHRNRRGDGGDAVVHLHGAISPRVDDGYPMDTFADGDDRNYNHKHKQAGCLLWYHDHVHGLTARHVYYGLAGLHIIRDTPKESRLGLPHGKYDVPLVLSDRSFTASGAFNYPPPGVPIHSGQGWFGNKLLVNGAVSPRMTVKQRLYRFRILNASNARCYALQLSNGARIHHIGSDGGFFRKPYARRYVALAPAQRADILIDFRNAKAGRSIVLKNVTQSGSPVLPNVMRFDVSRGGGADDARIPRRLRSKMVMPPVAGVRTFELDFNPNAPSQWQINGRGFDPNRIDASPQLGTSEIWKFVNRSNMVHPMHIHLIHFKVMTVDGRRPHPAEAVLRDTVIVGPKQTVRVRPHFRGHTGLYVFHCHALEHGDTDMMGQMEVVA